MFSHINKSSYVKALDFLSVQMLIFKMKLMEIPKRFRHCFIFGLVFSLVSFATGATENSRKLELLRERIRRLENRLVEDISLIREEFYGEISALAADDTDGNDSITTSDNAVKTELDDEIEALSVKVESLKSAVTENLKIMTDGNMKEKRIRREIQEDISDLKEEKEDVAKALSDLSNAITLKITDTVERFNVTEQLSEIVELLKDFSVKLVGNVQDGKSIERVSDCAEWLKKGHVSSGLYTVYPETAWRPFTVYCDMETSGGGWTVFQRRKDGSENFNRKWIDYTYGFGNLSGEFWLGNEFIHRLTSIAPQELLIELEDFEDDHRHAAYGLFSVGSAAESYKLSVDFFTGNVTDSLVTRHNGNIFSTRDHGSFSSCANLYKGGWWYKDCHAVNINGLYLKGEHESYADGVNWRGWRGYHYSLKTTEMKVRPH